MNKTIVGFGEIMGRIEAEGFLRIRQAMPGPIQIGFYGAEANVLVSLQMLGRTTRYVTALPDTSLGDACIDAVRRFGVDTSHILRTKDRLGLYFVETGANQRSSNVIYDRAYSAISKAAPSSYHWDAIFADARWFHVTGITPALSENAAETTLASVLAAKDRNIPVSCDLNFRKKLWDWDSSCTPKKLAERTMRKILPYIDVLIGNEEDADDVLGIKAGSTDVSKGELAIDRYPDVAAQIISQFPNIKKVAFTLRESISASHNNWGAMLYDGSSRKAFFHPMRDGAYKPYEIRNIVDRIGGGDAFGAGLVFALTDEEMKEKPEHIIGFATAASCLAHSIKGDFNYVTKSEVLSLMGGDASGRVKR